MKRHSFQQNIIRILSACRQPRTLHYIKDKFGFKHNRLTVYMAYLVERNLVNIQVLPNDGRNIRKITITGQGRLLLRENGVLY